MLQRLCAVAARVAATLGVLQRQVVVIVSGVFSGDLERSSRVIEQRVTPHVIVVIPVNETSITDSQSLTSVLREIVLDSWK